MNPLWLIAKVGGIALITVVGGATLLVEKLTPKPSNLVAGTIHFRKAMREFGKGLKIMVFGLPEATTPEIAAARKESGRIRIE